MTDTLYADVAVYMVLRPWEDAQRVDFEAEGDWWVAVEDGRAVGHFNLLDGEPYQYLSNLYVPPKYRGRGYGTSIMQALQRRSPNRAMRGEVAGWNLDALRLYLKMGWIVNETYWRTGEEDDWAWVYVKKMLASPPLWRARMEPHFRFENWRWAYRAHDILYWPGIYD